MQKLCENKIFLLKKILLIYLKLLNIIRKLNSKGEIKILIFEKN